MFTEFLVCLVWEDSMGSKCSHTFCSFFSEHMRCFSEGSSSLYEVIYEEYISISGISFFYRDDSLDSITHFCTDDPGVFWKRLIESFCCSIIRKSYHCLRAYIQERESRMEFGIHFERIKEESLHESMDIKCMNACFFLSTWRYV